MLSMKKEQVDLVNAVVWILIQKRLMGFLNTL